jgi:hypothetical protein
MSSKNVEFLLLLKLRDGAQMMADAANEFLETFAPKEQQTAVLEEKFNLKYQDQIGEKLGEYQTADWKANIPEKFQTALNILTQSNATIANRYKGTGYAYAYWIYHDRVFRIKIKP